MNNESPNNHMQEIWQCQPVEGITMSAEEVRRRASKFQSKVMWRNVREYVGLAIATVALGFSFVRTHDVLSRVSCGLLVAGMGYVAFQLYLKGGARQSPKDTGAASCLQFYRSELERQRDLVSNVWLWYLGPFIPGLGVLTVASVLHDTHALHLGVLLFWDALLVAFFIFVWKLNTRAARCLQRMIDELRAAENS